MDLAAQPIAPARRAAVRAALLLLSVVGSLALAEEGARRLHRGAYPFLNLFIADARYGVRLMPSATTRTRSVSGRVTEVSTNARGFRGSAWRLDGDPDRRVLLVGDSQALGFGVDHADSIAMRLQARLGPGAEVLVAAVPSWGPIEYAQVIAELEPEVRARHVIVLANLANDWFELSVPNMRRTTAVDGWAATYTPGSQAPGWFPGRAFLLGRSHLVLAARQLAGYLGDASPPSAESVRVLARDARALRTSRDGHRSRLTSALLSAGRVCADNGATLVVAALPLDAEVDPAEWSKYHTPRLELVDAEPLTADLVADATSLGWSAVDLLPVLRAAEPGAFLPDDYHLSPRGADAVAAAIVPLVEERP